MSLKLMVPVQLFKTFLILVLDPSKSKNRKIKILFLHWKDSEFQKFKDLNFYSSL